MHAERPPYTAKRPLAPIPEADGATPVGIVRFKRDTLAIVGSNEQAWRIVGIGSSDGALRASVSESIDRLVPLADLSSFHALLDAGSASQPPAEFDARIRRADGTPIEIACWLSLLPDATGRKDAICQLVMIDVTHKRDIARSRSRARRAKELALAYDVVFLIEPGERRARCLRFERDERIARLGSLRISLTDALDYLVEHLAAPWERSGLRAFVENACHAGEGNNPPSESPQRIEFTGAGEAAGGGMLREAVLMDAEGGGFFLCSRIVDRAASDEPAALVPRARPAGAAPREENADRGNGDPRVTIRTFGYFDVFVDGRPIAFRSEKAKELLALLVDRRGGYVTSADIITALWENEPITGQLRTRCRKVALRLNRTLEANGVGGIVESVRGKRRIVPELVSCDLFDHLSGSADAGADFRGSYLKNYSWAEGTLAELMQEGMRR
ncbi:hypothetical protein [Candidatus Collinsella stercoripullorum]|uniref:hypothetical protein n=1 Tax=Candidatus Collinsella stercoripullorum TaxID=2838522 RepID=UPI0022DFD1A8|nr:hypothetical protein [Candidatus Collinsella stercoripullorum]